MQLQCQTLPIEHHPVLGINAKETGRECDDGGAPAISHRSYHDFSLAKAKNPGKPGSPGGLLSLGSGEPRWRLSDAGCKFAT